MGKVKPKLQIRAPKTADEFVNGQQSAASGQQPQATSTTRARPPAAALKGVVHRASGVDRARITVYLDTATALKLRRHCFENGLQVSDVASELIAKHVNKLGDG